MFQIVTPRDPVKLTDPKDIRALAHPARLAVIEELYSGRELTATECAEIAGLSPSAMSYHLRSLEKSGIVERADSKGDGRERPWRASGSHLEVSGDNGRGAELALSSTVLSRLGSQFSEWLQRRETEDSEWRHAAVVASGQVWLRLDELRDFEAAVEKLMDSFHDRSADEHPEDARRVRFSLFAFPSDGRPTPPPRVK